MMDQSMISAAARLLQMSEGELSNLLEKRKESEQGEQWVTLKEAAEYAKVTTCTVRRWCSAHRIVWRKLNSARCGRIIIKFSTLVSFIMRECFGSDISPKTDPGM